MSADPVVAKIENETRFDGNIGFVLIKTEDIRVLLGKARELERVKRTLDYLREEITSLLETAK